MRGYHYFQSFWTLEPERIIICNHEHGKVFYRFAIEVYETGKDIYVGHLPKEIS